MVAVLHLSQCMAASLDARASLAAAAGRPNSLEGLARLGAPHLSVASVRAGGDPTLRLKGGLPESEVFDPLGDGSVMVDVSGDGGVIKKITRKGQSSETPVEGDEAFAHFNGTVNHMNDREIEWNGTSVGGKLFDSSTLQVTDGNNVLFPSPLQTLELFHPAPSPPPPSTPVATPQPGTRQV